MFEFDVINYNNYYSTLDVDFDNVVNPVDLTCTKEKKNRIKYKMMQCKYLLGCEITPSNKKGYHFRYYCLIKCDICRLVFDDEIRFNADLTRKKEFTNIIFDKKKGY
jgi:hypothetical protein